ncbi:MAG TPA: imidazoleglycerol-phosphate dehydratase HisB [Planctomycetota bacterium]|nr:imidazoleglycerol-phosphate dehydratase HisB [Planctomycetota bacterium]
MIPVRAAVARMDAYKPPLEGRGPYLRLDFNESTRGAPASVLDAVRSLGPAELARYPEYGELKKDLARWLSVSVDEVLPTNASDEGIRIIIDTVVEPGSQVVLPVPTFAMFRFYAQLAGARVREVPYRPGFELPLEEILDAITAETRLVVLVNPNNPTGTPVPRAAIEKVLERARHACVLVDEAYFPIHPETCVDLRDRGNLVVLRTFSKAFGLAGCRVGVIASTRENVALLGKVASPYSLATPGVVAARAALRDPSYVTEAAKNMREARDELARRLAARGVAHHAGAANFVLVNARTKERCARIVLGLRARGVLVRDRSSDLGLGGWFRVSPGTLEDVAAFEDAFAGALADVDGAPVTPASPPAVPPRTALVRRDTRETRIEARLALDGAGRGHVRGPIGFFDHLLEAFAKHGLFDLGLAVSGDLHVDQHHTVEDTGIVLGEAFAQALGDRKGIARAGSFAFPMEEALAVVAVDIAGRPQLVWDVRFQAEKVGDLVVGLLSEFFHGFARGLKANVHVKMPYGENDHHKAEAIFKAFAKAMKQAVSIEQRGSESVPSTKGSFD